MTSDEAQRIADQLVRSFKRIGDNLKAMTVLGDVLRGDIPATQIHLL